MVGFHSNLKSGLPKAEALRRASLALLKTPEFRHPFYWAGFILVGRGN
jgi:CHAT domain-containing protein